MRHSTHVQVTICSTGHDGLGAGDKSTNSWDDAQALGEKGPQLIGRGAHGNGGRLQGSHKLLLAALSVGLLSAAVYKASRYGWSRGVGYAHLSSGAELSSRL